MKALYTLLILFYSLGIYCASLFSPKARRWVRGRRGWRRKAAEFSREGSRVAWIHCASLGEFEQGRPLIEKIRRDLPGWKVVLTFFSPSGYEVRKDYPHADVVMYLPADLPLNVSHFLDAFRPDVALIVKYEFWYNFLRGLERRKIPVYLVSGIFRPSQYFFRWYGRFARPVLSVFRHIFVQDADSASLLAGIGITRCTVTGDTRFDRVSQIAEAAKELPRLQTFRGDEPLFVAGSSWEPDEDIIIRYINEHPAVMKWVIAPHEPGAAHIERLEKKLEVSSVRWSALEEGNNAGRVLIIDNVGMLSSVYRYGSMAAVGGGFGKGIHNILEAACWGIPVLFGPNHERFREANDLTLLGGAVSFTDYATFSAVVDKFVSNPGEAAAAGKICQSYVADNKGATEKVFNNVFGMT